MTRPPLATHGRAHLGSRTSVISDILLPRPRRNSYSSQTHRTNTFGAEMTNVHKAAQFVRTPGEQSTEISGALAAEPLLDVSTHTLNMYCRKRDFRFNKRRVPVNEPKKVLEDKKKELGRQEAEERKELELHGKSHLDIKRKLAEIAEALRRIH